MNFADILDAFRKVGSYLPMAEAATGAAKAGAKYGARLARGEGVSPVQYVLEEPSDAAFAGSKAAFPDQASGNTQQDAMRHMLWMAEAGNRFGRPIARLLGAGNELVGAIHGQPLSEMVMDLRNNELGLSLADMARVDRLRKTRELAEGAQIPEQDVIGLARGAFNPEVRAMKLR